MQHYNNDESLYYLLIVGDIEYIPSFTNTIESDSIAGDFIPSDLYYGYDSNTKELYMYRGRISVKANEAIGSVRKIISYERNPVDDPIFYKKGIHCMYFRGMTGDFCGVIESSENIRDYLIQYVDTTMHIERMYSAASNATPLKYDSYIGSGDSIPTCLRKPQYPWSITRTDVINQINSGCLYVIYSGHGSLGLWQNPPLTSGDVNNLSNSTKVPVIFDGGCQNGRFNNLNSDCIAELFQKNINGGSVGIFAYSGDGFSTYNEFLNIAMFNSIWPEPGLINNFATLQMTSVTATTPLFELSSIMEYGLDYLINRVTHPFFYYKTNNIIHEQFHLFGDPSMMIYTEKPLPIINPSISVNNNTISVQTTDGDARISFYTPGISPVVDSYLGSSVDYTTTADSVIICIDRHNCIPYVVTYHKDAYIQNENINDSRTYVGQNIKVGRNVTTTKPEGDVIINGANVLIKGGNVELHSGTTILNTNVLINPQ